MSEPGTDPEPPLDFKRIAFPFTAHGSSLFRTHSDLYHAFHFGRSGRNRFDDPQEKYGVLYAARDYFGAFIETFGQQTGKRSVGVGDLKRTILTEFYPVSPLILVDLISSGNLARIGADAGLVAGSRAVARRWSRAIYDHPDFHNAHGILFPARHDPARASVALFDTPNLPILEIARSTPWYSDDLADRSNLSAALALYGFSLIETESRPGKKGLGSALNSQFDLFEP